MVTAEQIDLLLMTKKAEVLEKQRDYLIMEFSKLHYDDNDKYHAIIQHMPHQKELPAPALTEGIVK